MRPSFLWLAAAAMAATFAGNTPAAGGPARRRVADGGASVAQPNAVAVCRDGALGTAPEQPFHSLSQAEVGAIVTAAASSLDSTTAVIAVVDRAGRVLALFHQPAASGANDEEAVGLARTAAFFSHNQAPLSSRTVRFISGVHFPPGVVNAPNAALYGIENTNRGCALNLDLDPLKQLPPATSINGNPCHATDRTGCGAGIVTGKQLPDDGPYPQEVGNRPVNAGGIPLYRIVAPGLDRITDGIVSNGKLVGGIGVAGIGGDPQLAEFVAANGAFGSLATGIVPVPSYPLPEPGNVFIDGIRLPLFGPDQKLRFNNDGLPIGLQLPKGRSAGTSAGSYVTFTLPHPFDGNPRDGGCADHGDLVVSRGDANLTKAQVQLLIDRAIKAAQRTRAVIRLPLSSYARMVIAVAGLDGTILALHRMPDATVFSVDVAVAKARNVIWFSGAGAGDLPGIAGGTAVTNRTIGFGAQPLFPPGIDSDTFKVGPGPFYPLFLNDLARPCSQGSQAANLNQNGIVFFPGATPLYRDGHLVGGLGVSGDGVEQDDYVTYLAAAGLPEETSAQSFLPDPKSWADRITLSKVRLPMFKFPRQPEGVTECGGKPCS
jgi:uncharacterized protein GlcG (DUF336 family)